MKNLFENARFGKSYQTRDGRKAIYWTEFDHLHRLIFENYMASIFVRGDGKVLFGEENESDIVSEWKEEINEKELDRLAKSYDVPVYGDGCDGCAYSDDDWDEIQSWIEEAYKAGYRKAMENKL